MPRKGQFKNIKINAELTPEKAYVLGVIGPGDGCISTPREYCPMIELGCKDVEFRDEFARCLQSFTDAPIHKCYDKQGKYRAYSCRRPLVCHLLSHVNSIKDFREGTERVPKAILQANEKTKATYLKGFFDSQGTVKLRYNQSGAFGEIRAYKKNRLVLIEIQILLSDLNIESGIYQDNNLYIRSLCHKVFAEKIGFTIKRKRDRLEKRLTLPSSAPVFDKHFKKAKKLRALGWGYYRIGTTLGVAQQVVHYWFTKSKRSQRLLKIGGDW